MGNAKLTYFSSPTSIEINVFGEYIRFFTSFERKKLHDKRFSLTSMGANHKSINVPRFFGSASALTTWIRNCLSEKPTLRRTICPNPEFLSRTLLFFLLLGFLLVAIFYFYH